MEGNTYAIERVEFYFWPALDGKPGEMFKVGAQELRYSEACTNREAFIQAFLDKHGGALLKSFLDSWLRSALAQAKAEKFIPKKGPSVEYREADKTFELCACFTYHDARLHHIIYESSGIDGVIMAPTSPLEQKLDALCGAYGASFFSRRLSADYDPDEDASDDGGDGGPSME
jgi:hypothetical protein